MNFFAPNWALLYYFLASGVVFAFPFPDLSAEVGQIISQIEGSLSGPEIIAGLQLKFGDFELEQLLRSYASTLPSYAYSYSHCIDNRVEIQVSRDEEEQVKLEISIIENRTSATKDLILSRTFNLSSHGHELIPAPFHRFDTLAGQDLLLDVSMKLQVAALLSSMLTVIYFFYLNDLHTAKYFFTLTNVFACLAIFIRSYFLR